MTQFEKLSRRKTLNLKGEMMCFVLWNLWKFSFLGDFFERQRCFI